MDLTTLMGLASIPVIIALLELVKRTWPRMPKRWLPLASVLLAVGWAVATAAPTSLDAARVQILLGIVYGLSAVGLFSGARTTIRG